MECLDKEYWEMDLYATLEEMKEEVQTHMAITEDLTNKVRGSSKSYLSAVNGKDSRHRDVAFVLTCCDHHQTDDVRLRL